MATLWFVAKLILAACGAWVLAVLVLLWLIELLDEPRTQDDVDPTTRRAA